MENHVYTNGRNHLKACLRKALASGLTFTSSCRSARRQTRRSQRQTSSFELLLLLRLAPMTGGRRGRLLRAIDDRKATAEACSARASQPTARVEQDVRVLATGLERLLALLVELLDMRRMAGFAAVRPKGEGPQGQEVEPENCDETKVRSDTLARRFRESPTVRSE
jgi:hypothetical protein